MTFFAPPREHFFRPLTHDNRELCAAVLRQLHERVHGANADYAETLTRDVVLEVALRSLADPRRPRSTTSRAARRCSSKICR